jgi:hypothetical protein
MENKNEIIINDNQPIIKVKKPVSEAQKAAQKRFYEKMKHDPGYMEKQRLSSRTHYTKHKDEVLQRIRQYQKDKLELAQIEMLHELQQERLHDLHTGDITQKDYDKLQDKISNKLAHLHLVT